MSSTGVRITKIFWYLALLLSLASVAGGSFLLYSGRFFHTDKEALINNAERVEILFNTGEIKVQGKTLDNDELSALKAASEDEKAQEKKAEEADAASEKKPEEEKKPEAETAASSVEETKTPEAEPQKEADHAEEAKKPEDAKDVEKEDEKGSTASLNTSEPKEKNSPKEGEHSTKEANKDGAKSVVEAVTEEPKKAPEIPPETTSPAQPVSPPVAATPVETEKTETVPVAPPVTESTPATAPMEATSKAPAAVAPATTPAPAVATESVTTPPAATTAPAVPATNPATTAVPPPATTAPAPDTVTNAPTEHNEVKVRRKTARIAIVVTGLGLSSINTEMALASFPNSVTLGFSAYSTKLKEWSQQAYNKGHQILVGVAMEPDDFPISDPGPLALLTNNTVEKNLNNLDKSIADVVGLVGIYSPQRERFTFVNNAVEPVLHALKSQNLVMVFANEEENIPLQEKANSLGVKVPVVDIIADNAIVPSAIQKNLEAAEREAYTNGQAVVLIHPYPITQKLVTEWVSSLPRKGINVVPITALTY